MSYIAPRCLVFLSSLVVPLTVACSAEPGTSIDLALGYDDALRLETADVTIAGRTESSAIAHRLFLLLPDELAGEDMSIEVWARRSGERAAFGAVTATPRLGATVAASLMLTACTPGCSGDVLTTCTGPATSCALGCSSDGDARCIAPRPSNGVDPVAAEALRGTTTISAETTFDVDTGAITGGITRAAGAGNIDGIGYVQLPPFAAGGAPLGVFVFHSVTVDAGARVRFTGGRAVVWLVGDVARIAGTMDVSAGQGAPSTPGPGGGAGGSATGLAQGCGAGGPGTGDAQDREDSGGAGGSAGAAGGAGGLSGTSPGGAPHVACLSASLEPLQGGSGGGTGSPGMDTAAARGGGGGGALQISALGMLEVTGTIHAGGAGGEGGVTGAASVSAAGGGGSGGAILLEAPTLIVAQGAILAANGGGGGGGAGFATGPRAGQSGGAGMTSPTAAPGGMGFAVGTSGGNGGARGVAAQNGQGSSTPGNSGGGGGGVGAIVLRARIARVAGTITPAAVQLDVLRRAQPHGDISDPEIVTGPYQAR